MKEDEHGCSFSNRVPGDKMADEALFDLLHSEIVAHFTDSGNQTDRVRILCYLYSLGHTKNLKVLAKRVLK